MTLSCLGCESHRQTRLSRYSDVLCSGFRIMTGGLGILRAINRLARCFRWRYWSSIPAPIPVIPNSPVSCRKIVVSDLDGVIDILTRGFKQDRDRCYWVNAV